MHRTTFRTPLAFCILAVLVAAGLVLAGCSREEPVSEPKPDPTAQEAAPAEAATPEEPSVNDTPVPEVIVLHGTDVMDWLAAENWWGEEQHGTQLTAPHVLITGINPQWKENSGNLPVAQKKELFYRLMLPLVLHANEMVRDRRARLERAAQEYAESGRVSDDSLETLRRMALLLPGFELAEAENLPPDHPDLPDMIDDLLYRVDEVPPGLALGQAAYESGYGTSRFAIEGNSLFGQWTYSGDGLAPQQKRAEKGNYGIKTFEWPFDSVRGYFINLMSHPAYEEFRHLRANLRAEGKPLDSLALAEGLLSYSERGREYVDSLKGMISHNKLDAADDARFRDEGLRFLVVAPTAEDVSRINEELEQMRQRGELAEILERMRLD